MRVQLVSPLPDEGYAFNAGCYWPVGLLTIGTVLRRRNRSLDLEIIDESLIGSTEAESRLGADIVGLQATSVLTYRRVLELARVAKRHNPHCIVVLGGPYAGLLARQILRLQPDVDLVVDGPGEGTMVALVDAVQRRAEVASVPGVWRRVNGDIEAPAQPAWWDFELALPLDYSLLPISVYHANYRRILGLGRYEGSFQIFTHFGCRYRDSRRRAGVEWCLYCALGGELVLRSPAAVRAEIEDALLANGIPIGATIMLKCYGDNASALGEHLGDLSRVLEASDILRRYNIGWSLYAQSCYVTPRLIETFSRMGVAEVYVGFDSVDDAVQRSNGLGTTLATHRRAARLLAEGGIRLQAGFVLGCEGETIETVNDTYEFCRELVDLGNVDLIHASPLVVLAGSAAFRRVAARIPEIDEFDYVDPAVLQREWLRAFCPGLGKPYEAQQLLRERATSMANLASVQSGWGQSTARSKLNASLQ